MATSAPRSVTNRSFLGTACGRDHSGTAGASELHGGRSRTPGCGVHEHGVVGREVGTFVEGERGDMERHVDRRCGCGLHVIGHREGHRDRRNRYFRVSAEGTGRNRADPRSDQLPSPVARRTHAAEHLHPGDVRRLDRHRPVTAADSVDVVEIDRDRLHGDLDFARARLRCIDLVDSKHVGRCTEFAEPATLSCCASSRLLMQLCMFLRSTRQCNIAAGRGSGLLALPSRPMHLLDLDRAPGRSDTRPSLLLFRPLEPRRGAEATAWRPNPRSGAGGRCWSVALGTCGSRMRLCAAGGAASMSGRKSSPVAMASDSDLCRGTSGGTLAGERTS